MTNSHVTEILLMVLLFHNDFLEVHFLKSLFFKFLKIDDFLMFKQLWYSGSTNRRQL